MIHNKIRISHAFLLVVLFAVIQPVSGKRFCRDDADCMDLGDLYCMKSHCDTGVCGCPRGEAAVFLGSQKQYECVKVKRVGEHCSTAGDAGICGAAHSLCLDDECTCETGYVSQWGGERCGHDNDRYAGETCSPENAIGTCSDSSTCIAPVTSPYWHDSVIFGVPTCACSNNQRLVITNAYSNMWTAVTNPFVGSKQPLCIPRRFGDSCLRDGDCPSTMECSATGKTCVCTESTEVPDYYGTNCYKPLAFGEKCVDVQNVPVGGFAIEYACDGTLGLVCGDVCSDTDNLPGDNDAICTCGPRHTVSGTSCNAIKEGGSCHGDFNCKGFSDNGICVDGLCQDGAMALVSGITLYLALLAILIA